MNLWPFSKKTKTGGNERFDLPPGVKLADPSEPEAFSTSAEAPLQVGLPKGQMPDIVPAESPPASQPTDPLPPEGAWESLPVSAEELFRTGPTPLNATSAQGSPITPQPPGNPLPAISPEASIPGVDFSQALPSEPDATRTTPVGIPAMESLFPADGMSDTSQTMYPDAFDGAFSSTQAGLSNATHDNTATQGDAAVYPLPYNAPMTPEALMEAADREAPPQAIPHASAPDTPQNGMADSPGIPNNIQNLRQKLSGSDTPPASQAHLPIQEPITPASGSFSTLENLKQQALQESAPSWLHEPGNLEDSFQFSPMADNQAPSAMATPEPGLEATPWDECNPADEFGAPELHSPMAFEPATDWAMPTDGIVPDPFAWNAPGQTNEPAASINAPTTHPVPFDSATPGQPAAKINDPLAPPAWGNAPDTGASGGESFWDSPLATSSNGETFSTSISPQAESPTLPDVQGTMVPKDKGEHHTEAETFRLPGPETTSEPAAPTINRDAPLSDATVPSTLPTMETPTFMQAWGHPDPAPPDTEPNQFSLPDPLTDGLSMNAQEAQPYLHQEIEATETPMDFLYGDTTSDAMGDFGESETFGASFDDSDEDATECEVGVYSFGTDVAELDDTAFADIDLGLPPLALNQDEDDEPIDEDAPPIAADFEAYDMGHYDDPDNPVPAFVLDDNPVIEDPLPLETVEADSYNLLDDCELAPPDPLPSAPQTIATPHAVTADFALSPEITAFHNADDTIVADFSADETMPDDTSYSMEWSEEPTVEAAPDMENQPVQPTPRPNVTETFPDATVPPLAAESPTLENTEGNLLPEPESHTTHIPRGDENSPASKKTRPTTPLMLKPVPLERTIFQPPKKPLKPFDPNLCERPIPYTDTLAEALHDFEKQILLEDTRFLKRSINNLVEQYFSQQEPDSAW